MTIRGKATHSYDLAPHLDSGDVSKYQAVDPTYFGESAPPMKWRWLLVFGTLAFALSLSIVGGLAIDWSRPWKLAVAVPVFVVAVAVLRRRVR